MLLLRVADDPIATSLPLSCGARLCQLVVDKILCLPEPTELAIPLGSLQVPVHFTDRLQPDVLRVILQELKQFIARHLVGLALAPAVKNPARVFTLWVLCRHHQHLLCRQSTTN